MPIDIHKYLKYINKFIANKNCIFKKNLKNFYVNLDKIFPQIANFIKKKIGLSKIFLTFVSYSILSYVFSFRRNKCLLPSILFLPKF